MKVILVPTDFSDAAMHAVYYASELALYTKAKLILFHVYNFRPPATKLPVNMPNSVEIESNLKLELEKVKKKIESKFGTDLGTDLEVKPGFVVEEIRNYAEKNHVDLIVTGMQGRSYIDERYFGSTTTMLLRKCNIPVLSIDKDVEFKPLRKIVFAYDGKNTDYEHVLVELKKIARLFHSHLYILHIAPALMAVNSETETDFNNIEDEMEGIEHSFHNRYSIDIVGEINDFVREVKANMVVMIPRKHSILDGILQEAETKRMAFHSEVPLLSLHE